MTYLTFGHKHILRKYVTLLPCTIPKRPQFHISRRYFYHPNQNGSTDVFVTKYDFCILVCHFMKFSIFLVCPYPLLPSN